MSDEKEAGKSKAGKSQRALHRSLLVFAMAMPASVACAGGAGGFWEGHITSENELYA